MVENLSDDGYLDSEDQDDNAQEALGAIDGSEAMDNAVSIYRSPRIMSKEEAQEYKSKRGPRSSSARILSKEEAQEYRIKGKAKRESATLGDYIKAVPTAGVDITLGAAEGFASAVGEFTGNQDIAKKISAFRTDVNDAMLGDTDESVKNNFLYKVSSGLGSAIPYLGLGIATKNGGYLAKGASGVFMLSSAGQQGRDDYLATQGVTTETASDEQISESNKVGAMVAVPIALSEKLGVNFMLRPFTRGPVKAKDVMGRLSQYAGAGLGEGLTEAAQSGILNTVASEIKKYDPEREITHGMMEGFLVGAIVGGGVNMGVDTVARAVEQSDRLQAGVQDGTINPKDVTDPELGAGLTEIAMENGSIPAPAETSQQLNPTESGSIGDTFSKWLTPLSRRLGRAGPEFKRAFRNYERRTGKKISDLKSEALPFQQEMEALRKSHPEEYKELTLALANAAELDAELPNSVKADMEKKAQVDPSITRSTSEQMMDGINPDAGTINTQIDQARQSLSNLGLRTRIEIVEDGNSYYDPNLDLISISANQADGTTVAHEYFHAVLGQSVKTDLELQSITRNMFDSVIRASEDGSSLNEQLKGFVSQYDSNIQNEEFLAQTVGEMARQYQTLDLNTRTRIKIWINEVMQKLGMQGVFKQAETDAEVIDQLNAFARFSGETEGMTQNINSSQADSLSNGEVTPMGEPIRGNKFQQLDYSEMPDNVFSDKPEKLSLITKKNSVDIRAIMDDVIENNKTISFFAADQLGVGKNGKYDLDGGPSFAFTKDGVFWMSGSKDKMDNSKNMDKYAEESDYIFVFSGSPTMHTFNKSVYNGFVKGIEKKFKDYKDFRKKFNEVAKNSFVGGKDLTAVLKNLDQFESFDALRDEGSGTPPPRKGLLNYVHAVSNASKPSKMKDFVQGLDLDLDSLRDGFYKKNDYGWLDLMVVGKPEGKTQKGDFHSTYADQFMGETLGVPDKKVNLRDLLSPEKYNEFVEKFVSDTKNRRLKAWQNATTPEAVAERTAKEAEKAASMKSLIGKKEKQEERVARLEKKYLDERRHTDERVVQDYLDADKPSSSAGEKINYSAGGMKTYDSSELRSLRSPEEIKELEESRSDRLQLSRDAFMKKIKFQKNKIGYKRERNKELEAAARVIFDKMPLKDSGEPVISREENIRLAEIADEVFPVKPWDSVSTPATLEEMLYALKESKHPIVNAEIDEGRLVKLRLDIPAYNSAGVWVPTIHEASETARSFDGGSPISHRSTAVIENVTLGVGFDYKGQRTSAGIAAGKGKAPIATLIGNYRNASEEESAARAEEALNDPEYIQVGFDPERRAYFYDKNTMKEVISGDEAIQVGAMVLLKNPKYGSTPSNEFISYETDNPIIMPEVEESMADRGIREQRGNRSATEREIIQGLSEEGMAILEKRGMMDSYKRIRGILNGLSKEYTELGLDKNFIENYFPRLVSDIDGYRKSFGQETVAVDAEIARYERATGQKLSDTERQMMYEKLARSKLYRSGEGTPENLKTRKIRRITEDQLGFYASPEKALDNYIEKMVNTIETKKLIGDGASGKTQGAEPVSGELGKIMEGMAKRGQLRSDQIKLIQDAVDARFGQHGSQSKIIKDVKNAGYLATMGNIGSTLTQLGDFYFTFVQNGFVPSMGALLGKPKIKMDDLGLAKDKVSIETADADRFSARAVDTIFKLTGLTAMDKLAKTTNINAAFSTLTKGAKANPSSNKYKKTLVRLKRTQGNDAYKTIADLQRGVKSDYVLEALYNELADVAPISLSEMPEGYAANPNGRILYSLKSYTIKQFNFLREKSIILLKEGVMEGNVDKIAEGSSNTMKILIFSALANGSADVLKAIIFGREIDTEDMLWNNILRMFGITKYTAVMARKEGFGEALTKTIAPPQLGILNDASKDIMNFDNVSDLNTMKNIPLVGKIYYWREGKGVQSEERLRRLKEKPLRLGSPRQEDDDWIQAPEIRSPRSMGF